MNSQLGYLTRDDSKDSIEQNEKNNESPDLKNTFSLICEERCEKAGGEAEQGTIDNGGLTFTKFMTLAAMSFLWYVTSAELIFPFGAISWGLLPAQGIC
jgi:hypothetical protein